MKYLYRINLQEKLLRTNYYHPYNEYACLETSSTKYKKNDENASFLRKW